MRLRGGAELCLLAVTLSACGTVDAGPDFQFAEVVYDENYFYCKVEPMLFAKGCGPGTPGMENDRSCHFDYTTFRLTQHDPVPCKDLVPQARSVPSGARSNYEAASAKMSPDPERAELLNRPTKRDRHPLQVFAPDGAEAQIIRAWATQYSSR